MIKSGSPKNTKVGLFFRTSDEHPTSDHSLVFVSSRAIIFDLSFSVVSPPKR